MDHGFSIPQDADAPDLKGLVERFRTPEVRAMALIGSFARGDAGQFSDVDILRFFAEEAGNRPGAGSHAVDGRLVVVSDIAEAKIDGWFTQPQVATQIVVGLRDAWPLWDPDGYFAKIQRRSRDFVWDDAMQKKADAYASREMAGWAEEAHKGLEGLRTGDTGRMINALLGLSWGLTSVMRVKLGVLLQSDNSFLSEVIAAVGEDSEWAKLCRSAFGIDGNSHLEERVKSGLRLYALTAQMIEKAIRLEDRDVINHTVKLIQAGLDKRIGI